MAKDWDRYKTEINTLYITQGRSLDDVRRILKGRHNFDASIRAYRMKLEEWAIRKNKAGASLGDQVRSGRPSKTITRTRPSPDARLSNVVSELLTGSSTGSLPSDPTLQFQDHETWAPRLNFSTSDGQHLNSSSLAVPRAFHDNSAAPYFDPIHEVNFASHQSLYRAILNGTEGEVTASLSSGISVNIRDDLNNSPLHTAILRGNVGIVKSLLNYGANVDCVGFKGKTPLHLAVVSKPLVQLLLKHQPNLSLQDDEGNTVLHHMLFIENWWSNLDVKTTIKSILSSGLDINIENRLGESAWHRLVADIIPGASGYLDIVSQFLNYKPNVTSPMPNGLSLLAVFLENTGILSSGDRDSYGYSFATRDESSTGFRCLEQFLIAGADPNIIFDSQPLVHCCLEKAAPRKQGPSQKFLSLLLQKADIDVAGSGGNYPLHLALAKYDRSWDMYVPSYTIAASLIDRQVNVNQTNDAGASPLEIWLGKNWRTKSANMKTTLLLVKAGADTTKSTTTGKTLFDLLKNMLRADRICLTKAFLEADINSHQDHDDTAVDSGWINAWRLAWKQPLWNFAKVYLSELEQVNSRPKSKDFMECAFLVVAKRLLERHRSQLKLWKTGDLDKESVNDNYTEYCAILRDCRQRKVEVDASFYTFLLDIMDFK